MPFFLSLFSPPALEITGPQDPRRIERYGKPSAPDPPLGGTQGSVRKKHKSGLFHRTALAQSEIAAEASNVSARGRPSGADGGAESSPMGGTLIPASDYHFQLTLAMQMAGDHAAGCLLEGRNEMP